MRWVVGSNPVGGTFFFGIFKKKFGPKKGQNWEKRGPFYAIFFVKNPSFWGIEPRSAHLKPSALPTRVYWIYRTSQQVPDIVFAHFYNEVGQQLVTHTWLSGRTLVSDTGGLGFNSGWKHKIFISQKKSKNDLDRAGNVV